MLKKLICSGIFLFLLFCTACSDMSRTSDTALQNTTPPTAGAATAAPTQTPTVTPTTAPTQAPKASEISDNYFDDGGDAALVMSSDYATVGNEIKAILKNVANREGFSYLWKVGKRIVCREQLYTPKASDLENFITITASRDKESYSCQFYFSKLPVVYINTENKQEVMDINTYINADCLIQENELFDSEGSSLYNGGLVIKGRGNASWTLGERHGKKPYKIKLDTKTDLFGMGESKHYVLLADWNDKTITRNQLTDDFSEALGMTYSMSLTNVVLIFNGSYQGLYEMGEQVRIESTRVDIFDWEEFAEKAAKKVAKAEGFEDNDRLLLEELLLTNLSWVSGKSVVYKSKTYSMSDYIDIPNINGGYLLEVDMYYDTISKFKTDNLSGDEYDWQPVTIKSPEYAYTNKDMMTYLKTNINAFDQAAKSADHYTELDGERVHYSDLVDMDSLVQYWLVNEFSNNFDSMKNSLFIYQDLGGLFHFGPVWDFDLAYGNKNKAAKYNDWQTYYYYKNSQAYQCFKYLISDPYFLTRACELYNASAKTYLNELIKSDGIIDKQNTYLYEAGIANAKKWYENGAEDYITAVSQLDQYIKSRKNWLDSKFKSVNTLVSSLFSYHASSALSVTTENTANGYTATVKVNDTNIKQLYILLNGKALDLQPVNKGQALISLDVSLLASADRMNTIEVFGVGDDGKYVTKNDIAVKNYTVFSR